MTAVGFTPYDDAQPGVGRYGDPPDQVPGPKQEDVPMEAARSDLDLAGAELTDRDRTILEFERQWWKYAGAKEQAIRDLFDMSGTRYYQILNALIDSPAALAFDPMLVKRLRRMRASRQRARSARRLGIELETR
jgi:Protein of unknown function (DUF3263)